MSIKKILIIGIILSLLTICAVSASATNDTTANATDNSSGNSSGIIGDLEKVLADNGYNDKHNESDPSYDYMFNFTKGSDYVLLSYKKDTNLSISTFDSSKFHEKTINNTKGIYGEMDGDYFFHYQHGKDIVYTRATDEGMLEKLALGN